MADSFTSHPRPPATAVVGTTLREHVLHGMHAAPGATGEFTSLLNHLSLAIRIIHSRVRSAGLHGLLGYTGDTNVQGEQVQKLDEFSNEVILNVLERSGHCGVIAQRGGRAAEVSPRRRGSTPSSSTRSTARATSTRTSASAPSSRSSAGRPRATRRASRTRSGPATRSSRPATRSTAPRPCSRSRPGRGSTRSRSTRTSASSSSRTRASAARMRGSCYSVNEGNVGRWSAAGEEVERLDQERGQADRQARTRTVTSARWSPTRTGRS